MSQTLKRACEYVRNTAGNATREHFDEDHEPIGPRLWADLHYEGLVQVVDGKISLTDKGNEFLSEQ